MAASNATFTEGFVTYTVAGESLQTYYKLFGSLSGASKRPLIALHGGPGALHGYLLPISDLSLPGPHSRPVLLYDQIGNGQSTHLKDKPQEYFTFDLFVNELLNLISHFSIQEYDILGHSWGGVLAAEFEVRLQPKGLKCIIFSNTLADTKLREQSTKQLISFFPDDVKEGMAAGFNDPKKYRLAFEKFSDVHGCTVRPVPKEVTSSVIDQNFGDAETGEGGDPTVIKAMVSGVYKQWSIIDRIHKIRVPIFLINGRNDFMQDFVCEAYFWKISKAKWVTFDNSSHVPMWEERERYMKLVGEFLTNVV